MADSAADPVMKAQTRTIAAVLILVVVGAILYVGLHSGPTRLDKQRAGELLHLSSGPPLLVLDHASTHVDLKPLATRWPDQNGDEIVIKPSPGEAVPWAQVPNEPFVELQVQTGTYPSVVEIKVYAGDPSTDPRFEAELRFTCTLGESDSPTCSMRPSDGGAVAVSVPPSVWSPCAANRCYYVISMFFTGKTDIADATAAFVSWGFVSPAKPSTTDQAIDSQTP